MNTKIRRLFSERDNEESVYEYGNITVSDFCQIADRLKTEKIEYEYSYEDSDCLVITIHFSDNGLGKFESESAYVKYAWYNAEINEEFSYYMMDNQGTEDEDWYDYDLYFRYIPDNIDHLIFGYTAFDVLLQEDDYGFVNSWDTKQSYRIFDFSE